MQAEADRVVRRFQVFGTRGGETQDGATGSGDGRGGVPRLGLLGFVDRMGLMGLMGLVGLARPWGRLGGQGLVVAALLGLTASAQAACSRVIRVPVAPIGLSVVTSGGAVAGVYPEVLRRVEAETGCRFEFSIVPRARLEAMFVSGQADLLMPASRTPARDARGQFVPLIKARPVLISLSSDRPAVANLQELMERRDLRVALVRGFDYGEAYQQLIPRLKEQQRLVMEADAAAVARAMERGLADVTLMVPSIFTGTLHQDSRSRAMLDRLRYEPLSDLGWGESGVYLSPGLSPTDRELLAEVLDKAARSGLVWKVMQRHYPPGSYEEGMKALAPAPASAASGSK